MTRKIIAGVAAGVLLTSLTLFAAQKAQDKKPAAKQKQAAKEIEKQPRQKTFLDQLIAAYEANDREKMGRIIDKMKARRDKMREQAQLNKWHRGAHRRMSANAGPRRGRGKAMAGPRRGWRHGAAAGWRGDRAAARPGWCAMADGPGRMPGFRQGPGRFSPQNWNRPFEGRRQMNIPPADWGW